MAHERAGQLAQPEDLIDIAEVVTAYFTRIPDVENPDQQVAFGTSGHRGSSLDSAFNEHHILATTQASVDFREDIVNGVIKSVVFGIACTMIALFEGFDAPPTAEGVSRATTRTVVNSSLAVLGLDFVMTSFMLVA